MAGAAEQLHCGVANFSGVEIGWLQTVREIPGFLAVGVILVLVIMREQTLALLSLVALGAAVAVTSLFPSFAGLLITTAIGSLGFHYYETVNQSLQLQWLEKDRAPQIIGWLVAAGSAASLLAYGLIALVFSWGGFGYDGVYIVGGGITALIAAYCWVAYPSFPIKTRQHNRVIIRRRYWLYYALQFMSGARRQIFMVFAAFMMVEKFGFAVHELTVLFLVNYIANIIFAPMMGALIMRIGEKWSLTFEYAGLTLVFLAYGGVYWFGWGAALAAASMSLTICSSLLLSRKRPISRRSAIRRTSRRLPRSPSRSITLRPCFFPQHLAISGSFLSRPFLFWPPCSRRRHSVLR